MKKFIRFLSEIGKLKRMRRRGWVLRGVKNPETIGAHTFRMAIMAWILGKGEKLDIEKILKMALIHDLCEVYAGDATPYDHLLPELKKTKDKRKILQKWPGGDQEEKAKRKDKKYRREKKALKKIIEDLPKDLQSEIKALWLEYEEGLTPEGRFVQQLDRVENLFQALEYQKEQPEIPVKPFWIQTWGMIDDPGIIAFMKALDKYFYKGKKSSKKDSS